MKFCPYASKYFNVHFLRTRTFIYVTTVQLPKWKKFNIDAIQMEKFNIDALLLSNLDLIQMLSTVLIMPLF